MMRDRGAGEEEMFEIDLNQEIYLRNRDEPVSCNTTFQIRKELVSRETPVEDVMSFAMQHLMSTIDVVREHRYILSDRRHNKFIWLTDEVQGVSILAPDAQTVLRALEE